MGTGAGTGRGCEGGHGCGRRAYSVAETSSSAGQGAKTSASVNDLAQAQLHLIHNLILNTLYYKYCDEAL